MKEYMKKFNTYAKTYDLKNKNIMDKFHHSYRVMEYAKQIAISENMSDEYVEIATLCGLLHDIGRFDQFTKYQTYSDRNSEDHGEMGYQVLIKNNFINQFIEDEEIKNIVLCSTRYHNKLGINYDLTDKEILFLKLIRDADKLDIMLEQGNTIKSNEVELTKEEINLVYNKELYNDKFLKDEASGILRLLCFIYDLNYKYSYNFILHKKIIENKTNLLEIYTKNKEIEKARDFMIAYLKEVLEC